MRQIEKLKKKREKLQRIHSKSKYKEKKLWWRNYNIQSSWTYLNYIAEHRLDSAQALKIYMKL